MHHTQNPGNQNEKGEPRARSLCLAMHLLVFALLFVLLDNAPLILHGVIWGGQTHNRGYANTYSYLCFTPHLCTFHQSICRSSSRSIHICVTERHRLYFFIIMQASRNSQQNSNIVGTATALT